MIYMYYTSFIKGIYMHHVLLEKEKLGAADTKGIHKGAVLSFLQL